MHGKVNYRILISLTLFGLLFLPPILRSEVTIPDSGAFVVDTAGIINASEKQQLEGWLRELEQKTTAQVKILTVQTTEGEDFFGFVQRHAQAWKLGQKNKDNGALIALALKEHHIRIHTGYGLEAVIPDSWAGSLSRDIASQYFKQGQYSQGLLRLVIAAANKIADAENTQLTGIPQFRYRPSHQTGSGGFLGAGFIPVFILLAVLSSMRRRQRYYSRWGGGGMMGGMLLGSVLGSALGGRRSHWGGGYQGWVRWWLWRRLRWWIIRRGGWIWRRWWRSQLVNTLNSKPEEGIL